MANKSYRIRTNVGEDTVIKAALNQDMDFLEVLSLKIKQEDTYRLHVSNYGIIVGRVLANDAFGVPNAKVSIFIPLNEDDSENSEIINLYSFKSVNDTDKENRRYNLLQSESNDDCYRVVGTFPSKRMVLDNDTQIEIYEKYWKYTTVTNQSGDFMIFGVPTGNHLIHTDIDLSDIGVLSQKPRDFYYKGYDVNLFDNAEQFKKGTNLDNLSQILSQTTSVQVYPFFGDKNVEEIAISRCDIQVPYKFEPTCVFIGSVVTDKKGHHIGHSCQSSRWSGYGSNMTTSEGTIEMIRKTQDGLVEEFPIQGNRLIDSDGVWCYQIPMNLDFVGTDEFGNIIPVQNATKGIPTRTSVRFRISLQETVGEASSEHHAKYLVPNIHELEPREFNPTLEKGSDYNKCYEFGSATPSEYFRDLLWNKVYTVKNYIPRLQKTSNTTNVYYSGIRSVNINNSNNVFPYNSARFHLNFTYRLLCSLFEIVVLIISLFNKLISKILCLEIGFKIKISKWSVKVGYKPFEFLTKWIHCVSIAGSDLIDENSNVEYFPGCENGCGHLKECKHSGCKAETDNDKLMDKVEQTLAHEYDIAHLDFNNDWVNGVLYMPLWYWKKHKKRRYFFGLFKKNAIDTFCNCDIVYDDLRLSQSNNVIYNNTYNAITSENTNIRKEMGHYFINHGVIKEFTNKDDLRIYYYAPGVSTDIDYATKNSKVPYAQLYATDIVLLGSLNSCDLDNLPRPFLNLPSTTNNDLFIATLSEEEEGEGTVTGMDWEKSNNYTKGLLMDLSCWSTRTKLKTAINLHRLSELDVTLDMSIHSNNNDEGAINADGLITKLELVSNETRAMFASLNHNGLSSMYTNPTTNYDTYKLSYIYPIDFDGHMSSFISTYTQNRSKDIQDRDYVKYRLGEERDSKKNLPHLRHFYNGDESRFSMPLYNNSFYFYFGLNEGKTAIDKFHTLYNASCVNEEKYPFTIEYSTKPGKWCYNVDNVGTDFGTIDIELNGLKPPFSYTLYNEFNEIVISETNVNSEELRFGYDITEGGGSYVYTNDTFKREGRLKYFNSGEFVKDSLDTYVYLENGTYLLEIINSLGYKVSQKIKMIQTPLTPIIKGVNLGTKYYNGNTANDICNEYDNFGEIRIESFIIDGNEAYIKNANLFFDNESGENDKITEVSMQIECSDGSKLLVVLEENESETTPIVEFLCNGVNNVPNLNKLYGSDENIILSFNVWRPGEYKITTTQLCNDVLNDNTSSNIIAIENGEKFQAFLNGVPLNMLDIDKLYEKENWLKLGQYNVYNINPTTFDYAEYWDDYLDVSVIQNENDESYISPLSKIDIINYQLQMYRNMMEGSFVTDSENHNVFELTTVGGKEPILIRNIHPDYNQFDGEISEETINKDIIIEDSNNVVCNNLYPNLINKSFTYNIEQGTNSGITNNDIYIDSENFGNYFAVFTNNGGFISLNNSCQKNDELYYESIPIDSDVLNEYCPNMNIKLSSYPQNILNKYVKTMFTDMRMGINCTIHFPITTHLNLSGNTWTYGTIKGHIYNGIPMKYDENYNLIGDGLEYNIYVYDEKGKHIKENVSYDSDVNIKLLNCYDEERKNETNVKSKFYKALVNIDGDEFDLNGNIQINKNTNGYIYDSYFELLELPNGNSLEITVINCKLPDNITYNANVDDNGNTSYEIKANVEEGDGVTNTFDSSMKTIVNNGEIEYRNESQLVIHNYVTATLLGKLEIVQSQAFEVKEADECLLIRDDAEQPSSGYIYMDFSFEMKLNNDKITSFGGVKGYEFSASLKDNQKWHCVIDDINIYTKTYTNKKTEERYLALTSYNNLIFNYVKYYKEGDYFYLEDEKYSIPNKLSESANTVNGEFKSYENNEITYYKIKGKHIYLFPENFVFAIFRNTDENIDESIKYVESIHSYYPDSMNSDALTISFNTYYKAYNSSGEPDKAINQTYEIISATTTESPFLDVDIPNIMLNSYTSISCETNNKNVIIKDKDSNKIIGQLTLSNNENFDSINQNSDGWFLKIKKDDEYYYKPLNQCLTYGKYKVIKSICLVRTAYNNIINGYIFKYDKYVMIDGLKYKIDINNKILIFKPHKIKNLSCTVKKDYYNTLFDYIDSTAPILYNANYKWFGNRLIEQTYKGKNENGSQIYKFEVDNYLTEFSDTISICGLTQVKNTIEGEKTILYDNDNLLYSINNNGEIVLNVEFIDGDGLYYEGMMHNKNMIGIAKENSYKLESILNPPLFGRNQLSSRTKTYIIGEMLPYSKDENGEYVLMNYSKKNRLEIQCLLPDYIDEDGVKTVIYENDYKFEEIEYRLNEQQIIETNVNALGFANVNTYYGSGEDHIFKRVSTINYNTIIDLDDIMITTPIVDNNNNCSFKFIKGYNNINSNFFKDVTISCDKIKDEDITIEEDITDEVCYLSCLDGYYIFGEKGDEITCLVDGENVRKPISEVSIGDKIIHNEYNKLGIILPYISQVEVINNKCDCKNITFKKPTDSSENYKFIFTYNNIKRTINFTI